MEVFSGYVLAALAAGLAIGFLREAMQAREQVNYLRRQLAHATGTPLPQEPQSRSLVSLSGQRK